ncbi:MAG: hypothetical protein ACRBCI_10540 [Cellvibrionaceae bacterium]
MTIAYSFGKRSIATTMALAFLLLVGCNGSSEVSVSYSDSEPDPNFRQFDVIDTYGNNSEFDPLASLAISPFINDGEFDLFWHIDSDYDYYADFRINDRPTLAGSQLVFSEYCNSDFPCHNNQFLYCEYQSDFDVICENSNGDIQVANIGDQIDTIPQTLYLILDVCDGYGFNCEYQTIPIDFE